MFALVAVLLCAPPAGQLFELREGTLAYTVIHKLHEVRGTSHQVEGRALAQPGGTVRVQVRVRIATFDSGNSNRDEHMREVTHEQSHPYAEVKGTISGVTFPLRGPQETTLRGTVELNGKKQPWDVPVNLEPAADGVRVRFSFPLSLDSFKVERPQLLFIKIDDRAVISGDLRFEAVR